MGILFKTFTSQMKWLKNKLGQHRSASTYSVDSDQDD